MKNKAIFLLGPTSSGKTALSLELARDFNGEVVNLDSQQAIKGLDLATNKIFPSEMQGVRHHMLDVYSFNDIQNVWDFCLRAEMIINAISQNGKLPIVVGGTGLYARVLSGDIDLSVQSTSNKQLRKELEQNPLLELVEQAKDLGVYNVLNESDKSNKVRLIRVIEKKFDSISSQKVFLRGYDVLKLALEKSKDLDTKIAKNVTDMIKKGLINETQMLQKKHLDFEKKVKAIGYKEVLQYLRGEIPTEEALIELITTHTRQYAKRQMTWLRKEPGIKWIKNSKQAKAMVAEFLSA